MVAFVVIAATDYDPDSPVTTNLAGAWSTNLESAFEGNASFKLQAAALDPSVLIINDLSRGSVQTASGTTVLSLGLYYVYCTGTAVQGTNTATGAQYLINGTWQDALFMTNTDSAAPIYWEHATLVASDGTNARVLNGVTYHKVL